MFADLRGFTSFAETAEPERSSRCCANTTECVGELVVVRGNLERFVGDGVLVLFNDPVPQETTRNAPSSWRWNSVTGSDSLRALATTRTRARLRDGDRERIRDLGSVGFERRKEYSVIGTVPNLACRLCDEAKPGQILISQRAPLQQLEECVETEHLGDRPLKGFHKPVTVFELSSLRNPRGATVQADEAAP